MYHRARSTSKRNLDIPLKERLQRTRPSSNYPIHLLSPRSKDIRLQNLQKKTRKQSAELRRYKKQMEAMSLDLSDQQSQELQECVQAIHTGSTRTSLPTGKQRSWRRHVRCYPKVI